MIFLSSSQNACLPATPHSWNAFIVRRAFDLHVKSNRQEAEQADFIILIDKIRKYSVA